MTAQQLADRIGVPEADILEALVHLEREHGWDPATAIARLDAVNPTAEQIAHSLKSWRVSAEGSPS